MKSPRGVKSFGSSPAAGIWIETGKLPDHAAAKGLKNATIIATRVKASGDRMRALSFTEVSQTRTACSFSVSIACTGGPPWPPPDQISCGIALRSGAATEGRPYRLTNLLSFLWDAHSVGMRLTSERTST